MSPLLSGVFGLLALVVLLAGVFLAFGLPWVLIIGGALGLAAAVALYDPAKVPGKQ